MLTNGQNTEALSIDRAAIERQIERQIENRRYFREIENRCNPFPELTFDDCFDQVPFEDEQAFQPIPENEITAEIRWDLEQLERSLEARITEAAQELADKFSDSLEGVQADVASLTESLIEESGNEDDRSYRRAKPVAAIGGIGLMLLGFSVISFAVAGFSGTPTQKDYHSGLAGMLACAGLGAIAAAVATNWGSDE